MKLPTLPLLLIYAMHTMSCLIDMKPQRIQLRRSKGWKMPPNTVKVDRSTKWGNPFVTGVFGTQQECVDAFRFMCSGRTCVSEGDDTLIRQIDFIKHATENIALLAGKNLACWCKPGTPCHADVLLEIANRKA